jgi:BCD family chlorophyll transporter-like MFS transporter
MTRSQIVRLSLVRFATSFLVVLLVGVLNRVMIAELGIERTLVGLVLSLLHLATPLALYFGFLSDNKPIAALRRTPYILIGMFLCCTPLPFLPDVVRSISIGQEKLLFIIFGSALLLFIGIGVTVSTVALHALIVDRCPEKQRGEAMTMVWIITLFGFIVAAPVYSWLIPTYDPESLRTVFLITGIVTFIVSVLSLIGLERRGMRTKEDQEGARKFSDIFRALSGVPDVWLIFVFIALADFFFFSQEYVLEAFGKEVFKLSIPSTTSFNLYMGIGILISMIAVNALYNLMPRLNDKRVIAFGCVTSSCSFGLLAWSTLGSVEALVLISVFTLGVGKGIFNVGMARLMVRIARVDLSGVIMGLWAVVGGVAIGAGELSGAALVDLATKLTGSIPLGYGILFIIESAGLLICLLLIARFKLFRFQRELEDRLPSTLSPEWV